MTHGDIKAAMDEGALKRALLECLRDDEFHALLREQVKAAVAEAVAAKDTEIAELRDQLRRTSERVNDLEQYSRRLCVNISGIPETANESTDQIVTDLGKMTGVAVAPADIDRTHRIGKVKEDGIRNIIVRFTNFTKRQEFYNARRELRKPRPVRGSTVSTETAGKAFISDSLTRENQHTMYVARCMKRERKIHWAWSDVGKIKIRMSEGGQTKIIRSLEDLHAAVSPDRRTEAAPAASGNVDPEGFTRVRGRTRSKRGGRGGGRVSS